MLPCTSYLLLLIHHIPTTKDYILNIQNSQNTKIVSNRGGSRLATIKRPGLMAEVTLFAFVNMFKYKGCSFLSAKE